MGTRDIFESPEEENEPELQYGIVASGPPVLSEEVETTEDAVEVVLMWGGNVLHVAHVPQGEEFIIGETDDVHYLMGRDVIGTDRLPLFADGRVHIPQASKYAGELTTPSSMVTGGHELALGDTEITFQRGAMRFIIRRVRAGKKIATSNSIDRRPFAYVGGALGLAGILLIMASLVPPSSSALSLQHLDTDSRLVAAMLEAEVLEFDEVEAIIETGAEPSGGDGTRATEDEGEMGDEESPDTNNTYGVEGPPDNPDEHLAIENSEQMVQNAGVLGTLRTMAGSWNAVTSPFGRENALGSDPMNALGDLMGDTLGANSGFGGLGLHGTGRGGGCTGAGCGLGTVGLGDLGTIGHGGGCRGDDCGEGYGHGTGNLRRRVSHVPEPTVHSTGATINGSLSREVIRRVVRRHHNEVKFCYEQGLQSRADLEGRVTTRFFISPSGAVQTSVVQSSSLGHAPTEQCINQAVRRWAFPAPDNGGLVSVTYPFMLSSR